MANPNAVMSSTRDRFHGCLLAGAVGDALGAPVEFMSRGEILRRFGPDGITLYAPAFGGIGRITDDTQMTLFTAEGLLRAWVRLCFKGISTVSGITRNAYLRWLRTQDEAPAEVIAEAAGRDGWLIQQPELHSRRAPGVTCLQALRAIDARNGGAHNDSKGCGGVMRVAPVGLFLWMPEMPQAPQHVFQLAADLAGLTHGHPTGQLSAGVLAVLVLSLASGASLDSALATAKAILARHPAHEETLSAIEQAEALARSRLPHEAAIARLGQGWVAEEALAISIYCALVTLSLRDGIILAVNHDGDSDSTGSITGNLLGAMQGAGAIPGEWLEPLELRNVIMDIADDLYDYRDWDIGEQAMNAALNERIWNKYPGC
jgi:ADP-ribosylglycohydrolase